MQVSNSEKRWTIAGQGLAGTCLAWALWKRGEDFLLMDRGAGGSSRVAAGMVNPITGKNFEPSWRIADFLPDAVAQARLETLIELARDIQNEINAQEVGRTEEVMIDGPGRYPGDLRGRTRRGKVVVFPGAEETDGASLNLGDYVTVRLTSTSGPTFQGLREVAALAAT